MKYFNNDIKLLFESGRFVDVATYCRKRLSRSEPSIAYAESEKFVLLDHIADSLVRAGDLLGALVAINETIYWCRNNGSPTLDWAVALARSGAIYRRLGRSDEAEQAYLSAISMLDNVPVSENFDLGLLFQNIARLYIDRGDVASAEKYLVSAMKQRIKDVGDNHPAFGEVLYAFGRVLFMQNRLDAAHKTVERAIRIFREASLEDTPDYATMEKFSAQIQSRRPLPPPLDLKQPSDI